MGRGISTRNGIDSEVQSQIVKNIRVLSFRITRIEILEGSSKGLDLPDDQQGTPIFRRISIDAPLLRAGDIAWAEDDSICMGLGASGSDDQNERSQKCD